jgi:hypothetical protein
MFCAKDHSLHNATYLRLIMSSLRDEIFNLFCNNPYHLNFIF